MGGSSWSEDHYNQRVQRSVSIHGTAFVHTHNVATGKADALNPDLDPRKLKGGRRESRDSDAHPTSNAIVVGLDVTGTMADVVTQIHSSLPKLMGLLTRKGYIEHPQILFAAIGDAYCDRAPLQVGQFESGAEMEGDLSKLYLEQGGGGQNKESYELFAYFVARHTSIDCVEKRGVKGYCFIIGDEMPYPEVARAQVEKWLPHGEAPDNLDTKALFDELKETYHVFVILPIGSSNGERNRGVWERVVGKEHVLKLEDPNAAAELIAAQIGMCEGTVDVAGLRRDLHDVGSHALVPVIESALSHGVKAGNASIAHTDAFSGGSSIERM